MWQLLLLAIFPSIQANLNEVFSWKEVDFAWPNEQTKTEALKSGEYVPENNLPLGLDRWEDKLFVTVPRWKTGTPASLTYIHLNSSDRSPLLIPYPSWEVNTLPKASEGPRDKIISTFRIKVDSCDRLWLVDTGLSDLHGESKQIATPAIVVFDLKTDKIIRRYKLKPEHYLKDSLFVNIAVDVDPKNCDDAFAYIPDVVAFTIIVYSWSADDAWVVKHNYFYLDPLKGDFHVGGVNFQWPDGVFGLALGPQDLEHRTLFFHALSSTKEFSVSTQVLKNKTIATDPHNYHLFKFEGDRGELTQSSASDYDVTTEVLFLTQINRDGLACWNSKTALKPENVVLVAQNNETMVFTNDVNIDDERNIWVFSNKMPVFLFSKLNMSEVNYRIFKAPVDELIKNTKCAV